MIVFLGTDPDSVVLDRCGLCIGVLLLPRHILSHQRTRAEGALLMNSVESIADKITIFDLVETWCVQCVVYADSKVHTRF